MSANRYSLCPRCTARRAAEATEAHARATRAYGLVPVAEFDALRGEAERLSVLVTAPTNGETFAETFEAWGASTGLVEVSYHGECRVCGLKLSIHERRALDI